MTSAIDPSVIGAGDVDKASVRLQLERARDEISAIQDGTTDLLLNKANPLLRIQKGASGQASRVIGSVGASLRWTVDLGNSTAESGSNAGSNFAITRYSDTGSAIDIPLLITRSTGAPTFADPALWRTAMSVPALPTAAGGVPGAAVYVNTASGAGYTLPAGGTWLYFLNLIVTATAANTGTQAFGAGVAGGTLVAGASAGNQWQGFAWRIS